LAIVVCTLCLITVTAVAGPFSQTTTLPDGLVDTHTLYGFAGPTSPAAARRPGRDAVGAVYAYGGPATGVVPFEGVTAANAENPSNSQAPPANLLPLGSYVPVLCRQIQVSLQAGSVRGPGAWHQLRAEIRGHDRADRWTHSGRIPEVGSGLLLVGEDALRVDVPSADDTPLGQWMRQSRDEAGEGTVSSYYTDLAGDFLGERRAGNPRVIIVLPDLRRPAADAEEPTAYTLPDAIEIDTALARVMPGKGTLVITPIPQGSPMFQHHYTGPAPKRQDDGGVEIQAGDGVEPVPIGIVHNILKWGQANPILAGLIAGFFAVIMGTLVAKNPGQAAKAE
jgi:hypothetical protein